MKRDLDRLRSSGMWRRGFAFTEVLFAVMVLGIGFIMIAAMFPVTIQQTKSTLEESVGASMARGAVTYLQTQATELNFPVSAAPNGPVQVVSMPQAYAASAATLNAGWFATRGNYINPIDPRLAWVPLYLRGFTPTGDPSPFAQVFVIAVRSRNKPAYVQSDVLPSTDTPVPWAVLEPRRVNVGLMFDTVNLRGVMQFTRNAGSQYAAPNAYVIIADDQNMNPPRNTTGQSTGRIYRLGTAIDEANGIWHLAPDGDMIRANALAGTGGTPVAGDDNDLVASKTQAYIIGCGYLDPNDPSKGYGGAAQDIAVYTGFIRINPPLR